MPSRFAAEATLAGLCSKANSGVLTPTTTSPLLWYVWYHFSTYGMLRMQLIQEYVQKSTSTTLPFRPAMVRGGLLIQLVKPWNSGAGVDSTFNTLELDKLEL